MLGVLNYNVTSAISARTTVATLGGTMGAVPPDTLGGREVAMELVGDDDVGWAEVLLP